MCSSKICESKATDSNIYINENPNERNELTDKLDFDPVISINRNQDFKREVYFRVYTNNQEVYYTFSIEVEVEKEK